MFLEADTATGPGGVSRLVTIVIVVSAAALLLLGLLPGLLTGPAVSAALGR
jgi:hypothetical protein